LVGVPIREREALLPVVFQRWIVLLTHEIEQPRDPAISRVFAPASTWARIKVRCSSDNSPPRIRLPEISVPKDLILMQYCGVELKTRLSRFWCCGVARAYDAKLLS